MRLVVKGVFQISVRGLDGKISSVELMFSDTIEDVKSKIRAQLNIEDQQRLIFEGTCPLIWRVDISSNFTISVGEQDGRRSTEMESSNTIDEVMREIRDQFGIPEDQQRLIFAFARRFLTQQQQEQPSAPNNWRRKSPAKDAKVDSRPVKKMRTKQPPSCVRARAAGTPVRARQRCVCGRGARPHWPLHGLVAFRGDVLTHTHTHTHTQLEQRMETLSLEDGKGRSGCHSLSPRDRKKQKTDQRPSGSHCTGKCKQDAPCNCRRH